MFGSDVLDVAIGVSLMFLIVSLMCSAIREFIEMLLKSRAMDLERGIRNLLDDPTGAGFAKAFYDHAQIFALFRGEYDPAKLIANNPLPGFAQKLQSLMRPDQPSKSGDLKMPVWARNNLPAYVPSSQFAAAILDIVAHGGGAWPYPVKPTAMSLSDLRAQAATLPSARLQRAVITAIDHAAGDLAVAKKNLEDWFDASMQRVSGLYKRRTQVWLFLIGLAVAASFNIDAMTVAGRISSDRVLRQALVAQAQATTEQGKDATLALKPDQVQAKLAAMGLPIGWRAAEKGETSIVNCVPAPQSCKSGADICPAVEDRVPTPWLSVVMGWLVTALAVTFGAPFWFDVLNRFMQLRSTLKPKDKPVGDAPEAKPPPAAASSPPSPPPSPPPPPTSVDLPPQPGFDPETWRAPFVNPGEVL